MAIDIFDLIFKLITLFFLAASSELSFKKRLWGIMFLTLGFWLTFFRTAILRSIVVYAGAFGHNPAELLTAIQTALMGGSVVVVTDVIALIGAVITFIFVAAEMKKK